METTNTIRIPHPSKDLVAFIKEAQLNKQERINTMRKNFLKNLVP